MLTWVALRGDLVSYAAEPRLRFLGKNAGDSNFAYEGPSAVVASQNLVRSRRTSCLGPNEKNKGMMHPFESACDNKMILSSVTCPTIWER